MSFKTITIARDFQVIDGFVQMPPNLEKDKNRVTVDDAIAAIPSAQQVYLSQGSGDNHGWRAGAQSTLRLPGLVPGTSYTDLLGADPVTTIDQDYPGPVVQ